MDGPATLAISRDRRPCDHGKGGHACCKSAMRSGVADQPPGRSGRNDESGRDQQQADDLHRDRRHHGDEQDE
jgi:hypothetical protein